MTMVQTPLHKKNLAFLLLLLAYTSMKQHMLLAKNYLSFLMKWAHHTTNNTNLLLQYIKVYLFFMVGYHITDQY